MVQRARLRTPITDSCTLNLENVHETYTFLFKHVISSYSGNVEGLAGKVQLRLQALTRHATVLLSQPRRGVTPGRRAKISRTCVHPTASEISFVLECLWTDEGPRELCRRVLYYSNGTVVPISDGLSVDIKWLNHEMICVLLRKKLLRPDTKNLCASGDLALGLTSYFHVFLPG